MDLDKELRSALTRREPPAGFADRVLERVAAESARKRRWMPAWLAGPMIPRWAMAGVLAALLVFAGASEYQKRRGEIAKARVILALHIAGEKLNYAQRKVQEVTLPPAAALIDGIEDNQ
jgi:hypothetical protein